MRPRFELLPERAASTVTVVPETPILSAPGTVGRVAKKSRPAPPRANTARYRWTSPNWKERVSRPTRSTTAAVPPTRIWSMSSRSTTTNRPRDSARIGRMMAAS